MDYLISVSFGELTLKGDNRKDFENRIIRKIKKAIADFEVEEFYKEQGKVYIKADRELFDEMIEVAWMHAVGGCLQYKSSHCVHSFWCPLRYGGYSSTESV